MGALPHVVKHSDELAAPPAAVSFTQMGSTLLSDLAGLHVMLVVGGGLVGTMLVVLSVVSR